MSHVQFTSVIICVQFSYKNPLQLKLPISRVSLKVLMPFYEKNGAILKSRKESYPNRIFVFSYYCFTNSRKRFLKVPEKRKMIVLFVSTPCLRLGRFYAAVY